MRFMVVACIVVALIEPVAAQDCTPVRDGWLATGVAGQEMVPDARPADGRPNGGTWPQDVITNVVPPDQIWIVKNVSIQQSGAWPTAAPRQYAIVVQRFWDATPATLSYWLGGVASCTNTVTPLCSWTPPDRGFMLEPNERLIARANSAPEGPVAIMSFGWRLPKACRDRWLGMVQVSGASTVDYTAFIAAVKAAATALQTLAGSAP